MEDVEKLQVLGEVQDVQEVNEIAGETPDQETLPPEALPPADVEQQQDESPNDSIEPAALSEQEESGDGIGDTDTKSISSLSFRSATTLRALSEELKSGPMSETFAMEIDEIDLFLSRTMHSMAQKLA